MNFKTLQKSMLLSALLFALCFAVPCGVSAQTPPLRITSSSSSVVPPATCTQTGDTYTITWVNDYPVTNPIGCQKVYYVPESGHEEEIYSDILHTFPGTVYSRTWTPKAEDISYNVRFRIKYFSSCYGNPTLVDQVLSNSIIVWNPECNNISYSIYNNISAVIWNDCYFEDKNDFLTQYYDPNLDEYIRNWYSNTDPVFVSNALEFGKEYTIGVYPNYNEVQSQALSTIAPHQTVSPLTYEASKNATGTFISISNDTNAVDVFGEYNASDFFPDNFDFTYAGQERGYNSGGKVYVSSDGFIRFDDGAIIAGHKPVNPDYPLSYAPAGCYIKKYTDGNTVTIEYKCASSENWDPFRFQIKLYKNEIGVAYSNSIDIIWDDLPSDDFSEPLIGITGANASGDYSFIAYNQGSTFGNNTFSSTNWYSWSNINEGLSFARIGRSITYTPSRKPVPIYPLAAHQNIAPPHKFYWSSVQGATGYQIEVYTGATGHNAGDRLFQESISGVDATSYTLTTAEQNSIGTGLTYHWRVKAIYGNTDYWSADQVVSFNKIVKPHLAGTGIGASGGIICPRSNGIHIKVLNSTVNASYDLYNEHEKLTTTSIAGTGGEITIPTLISEPGRYFVKATRGTDCSNFSFMWITKPTSSPKTIISVNGIELSDRVTDFCMTAQAFNITGTRINALNCTYRISGPNNFSAPLDEDLNAIVYLPYPGEYYFIETYTDPNATEPNICEYTLTKYINITAPVNQAIFTNTTLSFCESSSFNLKINAVSGNTYYLVFNGNIIETYQAEATKQYSFPSKNVEGTYHVYCNATNAPNPKCFVSQDECVVTKNLVPTATLSSPTNNSTIYTNAPTLSWTCASGCNSHYKVQISTDQNFSNFEKDVQISSSTSYTIPSTSPLSCGDHYWRVQTHYNNDAVIKTSATFKFTINSNRPTLTAPDDNIHITTSTITFSWSLPGTAALCTLQISTINTFATVINIGTSTSNSGSLSIASSVLPSCNTYYWRVVNNSSCTEQTSETRSFKNYEAEQTIDFPHTGWYLFSTHIDPSPCCTLVSAVLSSINNHFLILKTSNDPPNSGSLVYYPGGTITPPDVAMVNWDKLKGYQTYITEICSLTFKGTQIPYNQSINLDSGYHIIPYYPTCPIPPVDAMASVSDHLIILKDMNGLAYFPFFEIYQIDFMEPGQGYLLSLTSSGTLTYPECGKKRSSSDEGNFDPEPTPERFLTETGKHPNNSSLILTSNSIPAGTEIGVLNKEKRLVGSGVMRKGRAAIAIYGKNSLNPSADGASDNEELSIVGFNPTTQKAYDIQLTSIQDFINKVPIEKLTFITNRTIVASTDNIDLVTELSINNYPNPFGNSTTIEWVIPENGYVEISLYNIQGEMLTKLVSGNYLAGMNSIKFNNTQLSSGVYSLVMKFGSKNIVKQITIVD